MRARTRWRDPKAQAGRLYCVRAAALSVSFAVEPEYLMHSSYALMGFSLLTKGALTPKRGYWQARAELLAPQVGCPLASPPSQA